MKEIRGVVYDERHAGEPFVVLDGMKLPPRGEVPFTLDGVVIGRARVWKEDGRLLADVKIWDAPIERHYKKFAMGFRIIREEIEMTPPRFQRVIHRAHLVDIALVKESLDDTPDVEVT